MNAETVRYVKLFNRLDAAVRRHIDAKPWNDDHDDQLHASYRAVMRAATKMPRDLDPHDPEAGRWCPCVRCTINWYAERDPEEAERLREIWLAA